VNGISSSLQDEIKKTNESKKKAKFKLIATILTSNLLVAILCLPSSESSTPAQLVTQKIRHAGFKRIVLPVNLLVSQEELEKKETIVTLTSHDNKILVQKAYLHEEVVKPTDSSLELSERQFNIEIPAQSLTRMSDFSKTGVIVLPYVEHVEAKPSRKIYRGSKYEVSF
jgi:predicted CoA-binding protein